MLLNCDQWIPGRKPTSRDDVQVGAAWGNATSRYRHCRRCGIVFNISTHDVDLCRDCRPQGFCPHGHNKDLVGVTSSGTCKACNTARAAARTAAKTVQRRQDRARGPWLCQRGHDKKLVGADPAGRCRKCYELNASRHRQEQSARDRAALLKAGARP